MTSAVLRGANLEDADLRSVQLAQGCLDYATANGIHLNYARLVRASLLRTELQCSRFDGANLIGANLEGAVLIEASLRDAKLHGANMRNACLDAANLSNAALAGANLEHARLLGTTLRGTALALPQAYTMYGVSCLGGLTVDEADLDGIPKGNTNMANVTLGLTVFCDIDLSPLLDVAESVKHFAPSLVDITAVARSVDHPALPQFLYRAGTPGNLIEPMLDVARSMRQRSLVTSTFISYGTPDAIFAARLRDGLNKNGIVTFFFPEDAVPGQKLHRVMRKEINRHGRVILVCSRGSLDRAGVRNEIEETLEREARDGGASYLVPITLDDYLYSWRPKQSDVAQAILGRVVADFRGASVDEQKFESALKRLLTALHSNEDRA